MDHVMYPLKNLQDNLFKDNLEKIQKWEQTLFEHNNSKVKSEEPEKPEPARVIMNKPTMESVVKMAHKNPKSLLLVRDELKGWFVSMNQYRAGDDMETWMEIWDNKTILVDRVQKTFRVPRANVGVFGGIQSKIVQQLGANNNADNGFLQRCLFGDR